MPIAHEDFGGAKAFGTGTVGMQAVARIVLDPAECGFFGEHIVLGRKQRTTPIIWVVLLRETEINEDARAAALVVQEIVGFHVAMDNVSFVEFVQGCEEALHVTLNILHTHLLEQHGLSEDGMNK